MKPSLPLFLIAVVGTGWLTGYFNMPGEWYAALAKPPFNPPGWVFGPVWTLLYILIAVAGWRTWHTAGFGRPFQLWLAEMALNFLWSPVFFSLHRMDLALVILLLMLGCILAFIVTRWRTDRTSAALFLPYAAWVTFAGVLNASLLVLNS